MMKRYIFLALIILLSGLGFSHTPVVPKSAFAQDQCNDVLEIIAGTTGSIEASVYSPPSGTCVPAVISSDFSSGLIFNEVFQSMESCANGEQRARYATTSYDASASTITSTQTLTLGVSGFGGTGGECEDVQGTITIRLVPATQSSWNLACSPVAAADIVAGGSSSFNLETSPATTVQYTSQVSPNVSNGPQVTLVPGSPITRANITTSSSTPANTYNFTFIATANNVTKQCSTQLTVKSSTPPTADIKCSVSGVVSDSSCSLPAEGGGSATLSWISTNTTSCSVSPGGWSGTSGSQSVSPSTSTAYTLSCSGPAGTATDKVDVLRGTQPPSPTGPNGNINCMTEPVTNGNCTIASSTGEGSAMLSWTTGNIGSRTTCSITRNDTSTSFTVTRNTTSSGSTGLVTGTNTYKLICGSTVLDTAIVTVVRTPNPPSSVTAGAAENCGAVRVVWTPSSGAAEYLIYQSPYSAERKTERNWSLVKSSTATAETVSVNAPDKSNYIFAVTARNSDGESAISESNMIAINACGVGSLDLSDKDFIRVIRGSSALTNNPQPCNNTSDVSESLENYGLFQNGDLVDFKINVCNSGTATVTNLTVDEQMLNLEYVASTPVKFASLGRVAQSNIEVIITGEGENKDVEPPPTIESPPVDVECGSVISTSPLKFAISAVPAAQKGNAGVCSIEFRARIKYQPPANNPTQQAVAGSLYRFQNIANISNSLYQKTVVTRPFLFQVVSGAPTRTEQAP